MAKRINPNQLGENSLQPIAGAGSTFVPQYMQFLAGRPDTSNRLKGLSKALQNFQGALPAVVKAKQNYDEDQYNKGIAKRIESNKRFNEAIKAGEIHETDSPFYLAGYRNEDLKIRIPQYKQFLNETYQQYGLGTSNNPKEYNKFLEESRATFLESLKSEGFTSEDFRIMEPQIVGVEAQLTNQHINFRKQMTVKEYNSNQSTAANQFTTDYNLTDDMAKFYNDIRTADMNNVASGTTPQQSKLNIFNGASNSILKLAEKDPSKAMQMAEDLGNYQFRNGVRVYEDGTLSALQKKLRSNIVTIEQKQEAANLKYQKERVQRAEAKVTLDLISKLQTGEDIDIFKLTKPLQNAGGKGPIQALSLIKNFKTISEKTQDRPTNYDTMSLVTQRIYDGIFTKFSDISWAIPYLSNADRQHVIDQLGRKIQSTEKAINSKRDPISEVPKGYKPMKNGAVDTSTQSKVRATYAAVSNEWEKEHKNATSDERLQFALKTFDSARKTHEVVDTGPSIVNYKTAVTRGALPELTKTTIFSSQTEMRNVLKQIGRKDPRVKDLTRLLINAGVDVNSPEGLQRFGEQQLPLIQKLNQ